MSLDDLGWSGEPCRSLGKAGSPVQMGACIAVAASQAGLLARCLGEDAPYLLSTPALLVDWGGPLHSRVVWLSVGERQEPLLR